MPNSEVFNGTEFLNESHSINMIRVWKESIQSTVKYEFASAGGARRKGRRLYSLS